MPDLILYNANVIPLSRDNARAELAAVSNGRISWVGKNADLSRLKGPYTKAVDCQGYTLVPGFVDAHCHVLAYASSLMDVDCSPASIGSIGDIQVALRNRSLTTPAGQWIRGVGYNEFYLEEKRHPTRWDIDKALPNHPVRLVHRSGHALVLNSLALSLAGITSETPDPPGGVIDRDCETGVPSGLLLEMDEYIGGLVPPPDEEQITESVKMANRQFLSAGVTSLQDATVSNSLARWHALRQMKERGLISPRITFMVGVRHIQEFREAGLALGAGDQSLNVGAVKIVLTATSGALHPSEEELCNLVLQLHQDGFQVAIHAVEAEAVEAASKALTQAVEQVSRVGRRHRIEHCSECPPQVLERLRGQGLLVVTQPSFIYYSGERYLFEVPQETQPWLYRIGSFLKAGLSPAAGSDAPVTPPNPLVGIYAAITRRTTVGQTLSPEEMITPLEALKTYTLNGAYAAFQEKDKGSIVVGKLADLVLLDKDPTRVEAEEIKDIKVIMTVLGGEIAWER